ncbi:hypothetical protein V8953_20940 [Klebsiella michiganensis]|nr:hypothetical protein [Klebsiella michiganensis]MDV0341163.1 hypothetical protein [Klebsiella michiganensis]MDV0356923.1 hypothetical protein [Klebsiella michiganensis]MDV0403413.1 hypothetical protein [Klebsiella michiganensis]
MALFPSYPIFLWITGCKILFIVGDQFWKTRFHHFHSGKKVKKKSIRIIKLSYLLKKR